MSLNCLRVAVQRVRAGSRIVQTAGNARPYNVAVGKSVTPISAASYHHHSIRSSDKFQGYPQELRGTHRCYGEQCPENKYDPNCIDLRQVATYDEIVDLPNHPEVLLIDVRRPDELAGTGTIPTSINIPLNIVEEELKLAPTEFESKYGRPKPKYDSPIIFSCRSGIRAGNAAFIADTLGFTNVKNYVGSWLDYAEKKGLPLEPAENKFY